MPSNSPSLRMLGSNLNPTLTQREIVAAAFGRIPGAEVRFSKYRGAALPELTNPHERVQAGIPSMDLDRMTRCCGGQEGGHIGSPARLPSPVATAALRDLVRRRLSAAGLDYSGVIIGGRRSMNHENS
jgi:4-cresol dehydrogenase (hydroxylating) flavoprotein subunit